MTSSTIATVTTTDGITVSLDRYGEGKRDTVLIICPGFFQSKETATFQHMAHALAATTDVITMDFRGHGRSGGLFTFSACEGKDLLAVMDLARSTYPRMVILGFSLGGAAAINTVSGNRQGVQGLIAVSAPSSFEEIEFRCWTPEAMHTGLQGLEAGAGCRSGNPFLPKERPIDHIGQLKGLPLLFIHGTRDVIVGVEHSRRLFQAAHDPKHLEIIPAGGHAEALFRDDPAGFLRILTSWLTALLSGEGVR